jgi:hypothetical protein
MKLTRGLLAVALSVGFAGAALAEGMFSKLPVVGGAAYCALYAGDGTTCAANVPAGPSVMTGNERIPADTKLSSGVSPQTVLFSPAALGLGPTQYSAPLTGATTTVAATTRQVIIDPAGTIATHTLTLPAASALVDGQKLGFCTTQIVTALTVTAGSGTTVGNAPTAMLVPVATGAASCVAWTYVASQTKWFRIQ